MIIETLAPLVFAAVLLRPRTEISIITAPPVICPDSTGMKLRSMTEAGLAGLLRALTDVVEPVGPLKASPRDQVVAVLDSYKKLQDGWDDEHSVAPSERAIELAKAFLATLPFGVAFPSPMVAPTGAAELFWDLPSGYVDVSFSATGEVSVFAERSQGPDIYAENLEPDFKRFPEQERLLAILAPRQLRYAA